MSNISSSRLSLILLLGMVVSTPNLALAQTKAQLDAVQQAEREKRKRDRDLLEKHLPPSVIGTLVDGMSFLTKKDDEEFRARENNCSQLGGVQEKHCRDKLENSRRKLVESRKNAFVRKADNFSYSFEPNKESARIVSLPEWDPERKQAIAAARQAAEAQALLTSQQRPTTVEDAQACLVRERQAVLDREAYYQFLGIAELQKKLVEERIKQDGNSMGNKPPGEEYPKWLSIRAYNEANDATLDSIDRANKAEAERVRQIDQRIREEKQRRANAPKK